MSVTLGGEPLLGRAPLQRRLLATLLAGSGKVMTVEALAEEMWAGSPPRNARNTVQVYLYRVRRSLGSEHRIVRESTGYRIQVSADDFDAKAFEELAAAAGEDRRKGRLERAAERYASALGLWRGEPYTDVPSTGMIAAEAQRLSERRSLVHQESLEIRLDLGSHASVIGELEVLAREHPFRERLTALRAVALYRSGRQAEALQVLRENRRVLREELGIDPGPLLQRVHDAVLHRDERLHSVSTGSIEGDWTAPPESRIELGSPAATTPRELPPDVGGFTGRASELRAFEAARLGDEAEGIPPSPIIVISGMAGVGKTSSAIHWARRIADEFPDGQIFSDLRGYSGLPALRPIEALAAMLRSLGLTDDQIPADADHAAARLRTETANRRMLVLLDNAKSAEQVVPLLPSGPGSLVIVTSRNRLGDLLARHGGVHLTLAPLTTDEAVSLLKSLLRLPRSARDPEIVDLARRCGHLPLALRIAAANLTDRPQGLSEYTDRLSTGDALAALEIGASPEAAVRATFDRSYVAQSDDARRLFRMLGRAPVVSLPVEALAAVTGSDAETAERAAARLANANMAVRDGSGRLSLHDLLRDYANGLTDVTDPPQEEILERLFTWYLETAEAAGERLYPANARLSQREPADGPPRFDAPDAAARWLDDERGPLIELARFAAEHGRGSVSWRLADALRAHAWATMDSVDFLALADAALEGARQDRSECGEAVAELCVSTAYAKAREFMKVVDHAERAAELSRRIGWTSGQASAHHNMTLACWLIGRLQAALEHGKAALEINRQQGRLRGQSVNLGALSSVYGSLGDLRRKVRLRREGLGIADRIGDARLRKSHLCGILSASVELGDMETAEHCMDQAMRIETGSGKGTFTPVEAGSLAELYAGLGKHQDALPYAEAVARVGKASGDRRHEADGLVAMAFSLNLLGRHSEAVDAVDRALRSVRDDLRGTEISALIERGVGLIGLGRFEAGLADAESALGMARDCGYRVSEGLALDVLAEASLRLGDTGRARGHAEQAEELLRPVGHRAGEAWALWVLASVARAEGDAVAADRYRQRVEDAHAQMGSPVPCRFDFESS